MNKVPSAMILGTGHAVPERVLTNFDLEKMVDTNDEWIRVRTGIERRHIAAPEDTTSGLSSAAASAALQKAGISANQVDVIIVATVTGDVRFPATACYVQNNLGAVNAAAFDISAACSGFIYGLSMADNMIAGGKAKYVLVIGCEILSRIVNWEDRATCVLFGDGAGAVVLGPSDGERGVIDHYLKSDGRLASLLCMQGGGTKYPLEVQIAEKLNSLYMEGREVFKHAVTCMGESASIILERNGLTGEDIDVLIPHQANLRIINATSKRLGIPDEKVFVNLQNYGNTSAASIPLAIDEAFEKNVLQRDKRCVIVAFGGGFTWGSAIIQF